MERYSNKHYLFVSNFFFVFPELLLLSWKVQGATSVIASIFTCLIFISVIMIFSTLLCSFITFNIKYTQSLYVKAYPYHIYGLLKDTD